MNTEDHGFIYVDFNGEEDIGESAVFPVPSWAIPFLKEQENDDEY